MLDGLTTFYERLRLLNYRKLFGKIHDRAGSLSATEAFSADAIYILGNTTVTQLADFLGISQPNASYKVNCLINKGYIERETSEIDRRELRLRVSQKFLDYYGKNMAALRKAVAELEEAHDRSELELFKSMLVELNEKLVGDEERETNGYF